MGFKTYYEKENEIKYEGINNGTYDRKSRSRWDFAKDNIKENSCVLDVACGDGTLGKLLIDERLCEVYGIDIADNAVTKAKTNGVNAKPCDISSEKFPFEDNKFDNVTLLCCLEHIIDPIHCVSEAMRVLKVGGSLIVTLPNAVNYRIRKDFNNGIVSPELLHAKPGEGIHIQFFNYDNDFEDKVLCHIPNASVIFKKGDLKDATKYSDEEKIKLLGLIEQNPNMYSEYTHWIIEKNKIVK